jgi:hypothetical protein
MRNLKSLLLASAMVASMAAPALAGSTGSLSVGAGSSQGFTDTVNGSNSFGSEAFGTAAGSNGYAAASGFSQSAGGQSTYVTPTVVATFNEQSSSFGAEGYAAGDATFTATGNAFTQGTSSYTATTISDTSAVFDATLSDKSW